MRRPAQILLLVALAMAPGARGQQADDDLDLDTIVFTMEEARGKRRARIIGKLCAMDDPRAAEGLIQVLASPIPEDKAEVMDRVYRALYRLRNPVTVPDLKQMLGSEDDGKIVYAIGLLGRTLGPASFDLIRPFVESEGERLRVAIKALGETRSLKAVPLLRATLRRVGARSDESVFVRMSLIRLGDTEQMKPLIEHYQRIIDEAFQRKANLKYIDSKIKKDRSIRRIKYLWSVEAELREYFSDLTADGVKALVRAVETTDANSPKQIVFDLVPRMMDRERAPHFAAMLDSRYRAMRQLVIGEYLRLGDLPLRQKAVGCVRRDLTAPKWLDRRFAVMYTSLLPDTERLAALRAAARDPSVWVRAEVVRELGRWATPEALAVVRQVRDATQHGELRFICRCALAGAEEDLYGIR